MADTLRERLQLREVLRDTVREHKAAIHYHRQQLQRVATDLARLEADLQRRTDGPSGDPRQA